MNSVKDAMNASALAGAGGVQARRIAAEEGREYILQARAPRRRATPARPPPGRAPTAERRPTAPRAGGQARGGGGAGG